MKLCRGNVMLFAAVAQPFFIGIRLGRWWCKIKSYQTFSERNGRNPNFRLLGLCFSATREPK